MTTLTPALAARPDQYLYPENVDWSQYESMLDPAIEVDVTHRSVSKQPIYAALGVPELWTVDESGLIFQLLDEGEYRKSKKSAAFPWLTAADLQKFLDQQRSVPTTLLRSFRDWVRKQ